MLVQHVLVHPADVVFVKSIVEASDGVASCSRSAAESSLAAPLGRGDEFAELLRDLKRDVRSASPRRAALRVA